jgi:hypothetical protein
MNRTRKGLIAASFLAVLTASAFGAGDLSTLPVEGGLSFCGSTVSGIVLPSTQGPFGQVPGSTQGSGSGICGQTIPAGPPGPTGGETIKVDTGLSGGQQQTAAMPVGLLGPALNRIIGGDFTTNLWQRGTTPLSNATPTVALMTADRWWAISPAGTIDILKNTPANTAADYTGQFGLLSQMKVRRHTGSTGALTCIGQTLDSAAAAPLLGTNAVFSFFGYAPATYSASNFNITVSVAYFTAADAAATQAAIGNAGGNSSTAALSAAGQGGGITGYTAAVAGISLGTGTVASGVATIPLTAIPTRYAVYAPIPAANSSGTAVTGVSVAICGTFVAATSVTTDFFEVAGLQLEAKSSVVTTTQPSGTVSPKPFEKRLPQEEAYYQYQYSYVIIESTTAKTVRGLCTASTTSLSNCLINFPAALRIAPASAFTAGFTACTTVACTTAGGMTTCTANAIATSFAAATPNNEALVTCVGATQPAPGSATIMADLGTGSSTGVMQFSAEP